MNVLKLTVGLLIAAGLVVFGAQNTQSVTFRVFAWETPSTPAVLALAVAVLLGVLLGWIVSVPGRFRGMRQRRGLQHEAEARDRAAAVDREAAPLQETAPPG